MRQFIGASSLYIVILLTIFLIIYYPSAKITERVVGTVRFRKTNFLNNTIVGTSLILAVLLVFLFIRITVY